MIDRYVRFLAKLSPALTLGAALLVACAAEPARDLGAGGDEGPLPQSISGSYLAARHAERVRDVGGAARFMAEVLEKDPNNFELLTRAHMLLLADGRFDDAVVMARRILQQSAANPQAHVTLAVAAARNGNYSAAEQELEGLPLAGANRVVLPLMRAWLQLAQGRPAEALSTLRSLTEIDGFKPLYEYHAALMNDVAGRTDEAERHYRAALALENGPSVRLVEGAGNFLERRGKGEEARELYLRYGGQFPDSIGLTAALGRIERRGPPPPPVVATPNAGIAEALFNVAGALRQESGGQLALTYGRMALALDPEKPAGLLLVADILDGAGRYGESNALFARIPRDSPLSWSARLRIAENLQSMGQSDAAIAELRAMSAERPDRIEALVTLGQLLRIRQDYDGAARAYSSALERLPAITPRHWSLYYARGIAYERSKQWPRAEADLLKALELQPEQPDVLNYLAYSWVEQGINQDRALQMLERAVQLRPNSGHIIDSLGWALFKLGRFEDSVPLLERAVELLPEDPVLLDHLGDAYWRVGRTAEARFQWERSLRNKPEPELRIEVERKLERGLAAVRPSGR
ncbi:MAG TPA: tetratricopeptide repeat protein [Alphaproteobacteria bacterium]|nr:tetratricopeptide repeat protein [Alphaproteobacteria bacterium]